jgi:hypothetical protein
MDLAAKAWGPIDPIASRATKRHSTVSGILDLPVIIAITPLVKDCVSSVGG